MDLQLITDYVTMALLTFALISATATIIMEFRIYYYKRMQFEMAKMMKDINDIVHLVKQEKIEDITYWYDSHSNQFLAQGKSYDEIIEVLKKHYTKHIFLISDTEMMVGPTFQVVPITQMTLDV
jgi:hypothetical protein